MVRVLIGKVLKPRGLRGELKVQILTNKQETFLGIKSIYIDKKEVKVISSSLYGGFAYLFLDGIKTFENADELRDRKIWINKEDFKLEEDEVLVSDIIGFDVIEEDGTYLGQLEAVENYGAGDILIAGEHSILNDDDFVKETNIKDRRIIVYTHALTAEEVQ
ncbi:MAG: ribosome maturation factor RimM [Firmicutes bacterium]|nr:ribosome maturation factor RimM [Bacillota bacterium]